jgi:hypothetical protein
MKTFLLIIVAACTMLACKKNDQVSPGFFGKYELRMILAGYGGHDSTFAAGNGRIYQFNSDSTYKHFTNNKVDRQGTFHIKIYNNPSENSIATKVIFFDNSVYGEPLYLADTKLSIGTTANDGREEDYQKIQN